MTVFRTPTSRWRPPTDTTGRAATGHLRWNQGCGWERTPGTTTLVLTRSSELPMMYQAQQSPCPTDDAGRLGDIAVDGLSDTTETSMSHWSIPIGPQLGMNLLRPSSRCLSIATILGRFADVSARSRACPARSCWVDERLTELAAGQFAESLGGSFRSVVTAPAGRCRLEGAWFKSRWRSVCSAAAAARRCLFAELQLAWWLRFWVS